MVITKFMRIMMMVVMLIRIMMMIMMIVFGRQSLDWEMFESLNRPDPPAYGQYQYNGD